MEPKLGLSIILSSYNDSNIIDDICFDFQKFYDNYTFELILVNNGSTDNSKEVITKLSSKYKFVRFVNIDINEGYGNSIICGISLSKYNIIVYQNADFPSTVEDIFIGYDKFVGYGNNLNKIILKGESINKKEDNIFKLIVKYLIKIGLGFEVDDLNCQPTIIHRSVYNKLVNAPLDNSFDIFLLYTSKIMGIKLMRYPVNYKSFIKNQNNYFNRFGLELINIKELFKISWKNRWREQNLFWQLIRYGITGIITNFINYLSFIILFKIFNVYYIFSSILGYLIPFTLGYILHRNFTFRSNNPNITGQMLSYFIVIVSSLISFSLTIYILVEYAQVRPEYGQLFAIIIGALINFTGSKFWVFPLEIKIIKILKTWRD